MLLPVASVTSHIGLATALLLIAFSVGVCGHIVHSRALILVGIVVIAVISLWFVGAGEIRTIRRAPRGGAGRGVGGGWGDLVVVGRFGGGFAPLGVATPGSRGQTTTIKSPCGRAGVGAAIWWLSDDCGIAAGPCVWVWGDLVVVLRSRVMVLRSRRRTTE